MQMTVPRRNWLECSLMMIKNCYICIHVHDFRMNFCNVKLFNILLCAIHPCTDNGCSLKIGIYVGASGVVLATVVYCIIILYDVIVYDVMFM